MTPFPGKRLIKCGVDGVVCRGRVILITALLYPRVLLMKIYFTICPEKPNENGWRLPEIVTALKQRSGTMRWDREEETRGFDKDGARTPIETDGH